MTGIEPARAGGAGLGTIPRYPSGIQSRRVYHFHHIRSVIHPLAGYSKLGVDRSLRQKAVRRSNQGGGIGFTSIVVI